MKPRAFVSDEPIKPRQLRMPAIVFIAATVTLLGIATAIGIMFAVRVR